MLRCSPEAFAKCPMQKHCESQQAATFLEGSDCDKFNQEVRKKTMTNGDRFRAMTDEQLADALYKVYCELGSGGEKDLSNLFCDGKAGCITKDGNIRCSEKKVRACILRWFQSPVKEGETE